MALRGIGKSRVWDTFHNISEITSQTKLNSTQVHDRSKNMSTFVGRDTSVQSVKAAKHSFWNHACRRKIESHSLKLIDEPTYNHSAFTSIAVPNHQHNEDARVCTRIHSNRIFQSDDSARSKPQPTNALGRRLLHFTPRTCLRLQ